MNTKLTWEEDIWINWWPILPNFRYTSFLLVHLSSPSETPIRYNEIDHNSHWLFSPTFATIHPYYSSYPFNFNFINKQHDFHFEANLFFFVINQQPSSHSPIFANILLLNFTLHQNPHHLTFNHPIFNSQPPPSILTSTFFQLPPSQTLLLQFKL